MEFGSVISVKGFVDKSLILVTSKIQSTFELDFNPLKTVIRLNPQ